MIRAITASLLLIAAAPLASAQETALPGDLQALLEAAAQADDAATFEQAVRLLVLTQSPDAVAAGAGAVSEARAAQARAILGLAPQAPGMDTTVAAAPQPAQSEPVPGPVWRSVPLGAARALAGADPDTWSGEARLGLRYDGGNSDRQDYTVGLKAERALSVWGFNAELDYAYSEVDGAVGRDELRAFSQLDREAGERWTVYVSGEYRQDALSGYDYTALLGAGAGYRLFQREDLAWKIEAGPAVRVLQPTIGDSTYEAVLELGSDLEYQINEVVSFTSRTSALIGENSRAEQAFAVDTALGELWSLRLSYKYTYEFEPEPGFENADTRTDVEIVRRF